LQNSQARLSNNRSIFVGDSTIVNVKKLSHLTVFNQSIKQSLGALKMQDWKMTDESAGLENAGLENNGFEFAELEI